MKLVGAYGVFCTCCICIFAWLHFVCVLPPLLIQYNILNHMCRMMKAFKLDAMVTFEQLMQDLVAAESLKRNVNAIWLSLVKILCLV